MNLYVLQPNTTTQSSLPIDSVTDQCEQYDYVELSREVKALDDMDDGSVHSANGGYSGEPKSYDSSRSLGSPISLLQL
jgi:hypothetical protein